MILILSDDKKQEIGKRLYESLRNKDEEVQYISVSDLEVSTCYNCGYCLKKEYMKCAIKDDMQQILYEAAKCKQLVLVGPIIWGSYSSKIKKIFDRLAVIGDRHYYVAGGELVKGSADAKNSIWGIGIKSMCSEEEKNLFTQLVEENRKIMNVTGKGMIFSESPSEEELEKAVEVIRHA